MDNTLIVWKNGEPKVQTNRIASEVANEITKELDLSESEFVSIRDQLEEILGDQMIRLEQDYLFLG